MLFLRYREHSGGNRLAGCHAAALINHLHCPHLTEGLAIGRELLSATTPGHYNLLTERHRNHLEPGSCGGAQNALQKIRNDLVRENAEAAGPFYDTNSSGDLMSRFTCGSGRTIGQMLNSTLVQPFSSISIVKFLS